MSPAKKDKKKQQQDYIWSVGRRKEAVARVRLFTKKAKKGDDSVDIIVNGKPIGQYFHNPVAKMIYAKPLELTKTLDKYSATVKVVGSGLEAQMEAVMHGIARALVKADEVYRPTLREHGLLTRDDRSRQKRMIGRGGRARAKKQSPKR